jgi:pimeloyl-ACP methyl ester carboxylesterase
MQAVATIRGWRPQLRMEAALVTLPASTLFICGDHDPLASPDVARQLSTGMPDAHLTVIPDAGHIPHLDQPEPVAAALNEFLSHPLTTG